MKKNDFFKCVLSFAADGVYTAAVIEMKLLAPTWPSMWNSLKKRATKKSTFWSSPYQLSIMTVNWFDDEISNLSF